MTPKSPSLTLAAPLLALAAACLLIAGCAHSKPAAPATAAPQHAPTASSPAAPATLDGLQKELRALVRQPQFAAGMFGIQVASLDTGKVLFENDAHKLLKPASNAKMYTGALALDRLGPDYRIRTSFYADAQPGADGALAGDLIVYGRGDPSLSWRFHETNYDKAIGRLVDAVAGAGIKTVRGDLVGDESYFRGPIYGTSWTVEDMQQYYGAGASALSLEENAVDFVFRPGPSVGAPCSMTMKPATGYLVFSNRTATLPAGAKGTIDIYRPVGENVVYLWGGLPLGGAPFEDSVAVHDPARYFVTQLREALARRGIQVEGKVRTVDWVHRDLEPFDASRHVEVAHVESAPMSEMVSRMMKPSQNLYAQLLLLQVGARKMTKRQGWATTEDAGLAEMRQFLAEAGVPKGEALLEEGSGLSRGALVTPNASVRLLTYMSQHRHARAFDASLPLGGADGTLRRRFLGTRAANNLRAKTGTIRYVSTISGYVTSAAGERLVFSLMLNGYNHDDARAQLDKVAVKLADFQGHSREAAAPAASSGK